jgi:hypothetical protein
VRRKTPGHKLHSCVRGAAAVDSAFRGSNGTRDAALTKSGGFKERLRESMEVARATTPRGLHIFVVGRSEGPYCSRAYARTSDFEEVGEPVAGAEARGRRSLGARKSRRKRSRLSVDNPQQRRGPARTRRRVHVARRAREGRGFEHGSFQPSPTTFFNTVESSSLVLLAIGRTTLAPQAVGQKGVACLTEGSRAPPHPEAWRSQRESSPQLVGRLELGAAT